MNDKRTIIVVEDEENMRSLLSYNLEKEGYDVATANNGEEGLLQVREHHPDLIISDVMMPKMNGYDFCLALRDDVATQGIPFIFLSAKGQLPDKFEGLNRGADDYITKPFNINELLAMVKTRMKRVDIYKHIADTDELTSLLNRRALLEHLHGDIERARKFGRNLCVGFLDIDLFRKINERYGHPAADIALAKLAQTIKGMLHERDFAGRYGGEEFLVVLADKDRDKALCVLEDIRSVIEKMIFDVPTLRVTLSIGAACFPEDAGDMEQLIDASDKALLVAKHTGRNRVIMFSKVKEAKNGQS
jgi:diguanylate cyclase (GGDEF)-like protein